MPISELSQDSLVLYKSRPGRIAQIGRKKMDVEVEGGQIISVRFKDVILLHPGPLDSLAALRPQTGEVKTAWELLAGETTDLAELAELAYGDNTPATAWAAWQLVSEGLYFGGSPDNITAHTPDEVAEKKAARAAKAAEEKAKIAFLERAAMGQYRPEDKPYLEEVAALAYGQTDRSRVLQDLGQRESPQGAHAFLLKVGYWDPAVNPYPRRAGLPNTSPDVILPHLPNERRRNLTHLVALAIDDDGSRDPDDALSLENGRLWVHIADVAAVVPPNSPADMEARARGANLYLPEGVVTMLPFQATQMLGLGLADTSPALSFGLELSPEGDVTSLEIVPSWVRVTRLTYDEAQARIEEPPLRQLYQVAQRNEARRRDNGAAVIDLPEVSVRVEEGDVVIRPLLPLPSRDLVREAMLMAGEAMAGFAVEHGIPVPFTSQDTADADQLLIAGLADSPAAMFALRRTLKASQQTSSPAPHAGLGLTAYTQATSPLRRYLDLVVHQQLRAYIRGEGMLDPQAITERIGATGALIGSVRWAERRSIQHWTLVYLMQHADWRGEGFVVDRRGNKDVLLIPELGLETRQYQRRAVALDSVVSLALNNVNLVELDAHFRYLG